MSQKYQERIGTITGTSIDSKTLAGGKRQNRKRTQQEELASLKSKLER